MAHNPRKLQENTALEYEAWELLSPPYVGCLQRIDSAVKL